MRIRWNFDGSGSATGAEVSHRFPRPGTYKVVVGATSEANPTGASDIVTVRVGEAPEEGPDREGGGTNDAADAPDSGAATSESDPGAGAGAAAAAERRRARAAAARRRARATAARRRSATRARSEEPDGEQVEGTLIGAPFEPPPPTADERAAARTGVPQEPAPELPPQLVFGLIAVALVALGAWSERRSRRRFSTVGAWTAPAPPT